MFHRSFAAVMKYRTVLPLTVTSSRAPGRCIDRIDKISIDFSVFAIKTSYRVLIAVSAISLALLVVYFTKLLTDRRLLENKI